MYDDISCLLAWDWPCYSLDSKDQLHLLCTGQVEAGGGGGWKAEERQVEESEERNKFLLQFSERFESIDRLSL